MKKLVYLFAFVAMSLNSLSAQAPSYTDFEWDIVRLGYAAPAGSDNVGGGISLGTEVRYNLKDNLSLGLRYEIAVFSAADDIGNGSVGASGSYALIGDYYLKTTSSKRAFVGLGIGQFVGGDIEVDGSEETIEAGSSIGLIPRVGYEFGHLRLSAEYNLAFKEEVASYIGIHLGITLFGGYDG